VAQYSVLWETALPEGIGQVREFRSVKSWTRVRDVQPRSVTLLVAKIIWSEDGEVQVKSCPGVIRWSHEPSSQVAEQHD